VKLIYCRECGDVVALRAEPRTCICGKSGGNYKDDRLHAVIYGPCVPLGFANRFFGNALAMQPDKGPGVVFDAFVIEKSCPTIEVVTEPHPKDSANG
jgi:hypothetical protein